MGDKNKKRDPMPPSDATPEDIGEFWDTHSLADYWDETHEVESQVNLKSRQDMSPDESKPTDQRDTLSAEQGWRKLKELIQSIKPKEFEELIATLLTLFLKIPFVVARSGAQPSGDARNLSGDVSMQAKRYTSKRDPNTKTIEGDIRDTIRELPYLEVYVLVVSRDAAQLHDKFDTVSEETGLDIVILELSNELSDLGALCVTYWEDTHHFFDLSDPNQKFSAWVPIAKDDSNIHDRLKDIRKKLEDGIQTQKHVQKDIAKHLLERFSRDQGFNPINLSQAIERESLESKIMDWWTNNHQPVCCLEGKEGHGKSWLAAKGLTSICENESVVAFWLDSKDWSGHKSIFDLLHTCFSVIYPSYEQRKITKLQNKPAKIWRKTLIILDGVNERNAIDAAQQILTEYFRNDESEWKERVRFLLTTRPLDDYPDFERYLWSDCPKISVDSFNDSELQEALTRKGLQPNDLPDSLKDTARIPRYFQTCIRLRNQFRSFNAVTKEMILWADLIDKIETDPQIKQKLGWHRAKDAQEILSDLAKHAKWTNIDAGPQASAQMLEKYFLDYREVRHDLEEQRIAIEAGLLEVKLSEDHIKLGWALYLANLFDCTEFTQIKDAAEGFQNALEPIPSEDLRTEALFVALQISDISPPDISQDQLSQKRAALMLAWFHSHNAHITDERLSFWAEQDPDAYAQVVEFEFEHPNAPKYEEMLIEPLAKAWLDEKGQIDRLALPLKKWLLPTHSVNSPENREYTDFKGHQIPKKNYDPQVQLSAAALSILSQRPDPEFLETLARCYEILERYESPDQDIGILMRWGYTEKVLEDLYSLAEQSPSDTQLLKGVCRLVDFFRMGLLPNLKSVLSKEDLEKRAFIEQYDPILNPFINRIRNQERILTGDSPETNANRGYFDLGCLAVRKDLSLWCDEDQNEIKRISHYVSVSPEKGVNKDLIPWIAKYDPEGYRELSCNLKINALNPEYPLYALRVTQELIFERKDCKRITEAILEMKECLLQGNDSSCEYADLLTEILLFSASEDRLTDWFEFLASHEPLRFSICYEPLPYLLVELLPESIVELARQKLEKLRSSVSDNQPLSNDESQEFSEEEFWCTLYAYGTPVDENSVKFALSELKLRKPDSTGTYPMLRLALSNSKQFLDEMLIDKRIQEHLFSKNGRQFIVRPYDQSEDVIVHDKLMSLLPQEIVGSFLCSSDRRDDLSRWGRELITRMCSILQGVEGDSNSVEEKRIDVNSDALRAWAEQDTTNFLQLANEYLTQLSKFPQYSQALSYFTNTIRCLLLRFEPDKAKRYYHQWNAESFKTVYRTRYGVPTLLAQLWKVESCNSPAHRQFRRELLEECLNDEEIMFMTLAALAEGGRDELWSLVKNEYLESHYAKERNLGVSILPWFGTCEAINELKRLKSKDSSRWVREHAAWAYEVTQQERSCREVYREALQTRDMLRISAVFEQMKPALSPTARWWHEIEHKKFREESQDIDPKLAALVDRFWSLWGNSEEMKRNIEVFRRKLREYCRGEKFLAGRPPRIAPWWKPTSDFGS